MVTNMCVRFLQETVDSILSFLYPPLCLSCKAYTSHSHLLCENCIHELDLLQFDERCPMCFCEFETSTRNCLHCEHIKPLWDFAAACFSYKDPIRQIILNLKYRNSPYLAKTLASFMCVQYLKLGWPTPDVIIDVPQTKLRTFERGYNQSKCLAKELAKFLQIPHESLLIKQGQTYPQTLLSKRERKNIQDDIFKLKPGVSIEDKIILIIDDVYTTGTTLNRSSKALLSGYPKRIYALTSAIKN